MPHEALGDLIARVKRANPELTDAEIARRAGVQRTTPADWAKTGLKEVSPATVRKIATGLGVSVSEVVRVVLVSLGLPAEPSPTVEHAIQADPDLSLSAKETLLALVRHDREKRGATVHEFTRPEPPSAAEAKTAKPSGSEIGH
jgi:transcriptional regulator with XRE-family HTH domain